MVSNFPGPYEVRVRYDTTPTGESTLFHVQRLNVDLTAVPDPGDAFNNTNCKTRGGVLEPVLSDAAEAYLTLIAPVFHTSVNFGAWELWAYTPQTFQATFISAYTPTVSAGTGITTSGIAQQDILTFRTTEGGILRLNYMEKGDRPYQKTAYPTAVSTINDIFDFVISPQNWILGRDTSYPFASLNYLVGQNEKLFRIRYR